MTLLRTLTLAGCLCGLAFGFALADVVPGSEKVEAKARWNGAPTVFRSLVDRGPEGDILDLQATIREARRVRVDRFLPNGGMARIRTIAFAQADRDRDEELVVIVAWPHVTAEARGELYEVRIYDDPGSASTGWLVPMADLNHHFAQQNGCDCTLADGRRLAYPFKTAGAVKAELEKLQVGPPPRRRR